MNDFGLSLMCTDMLFSFAVLATILTVIGQVASGHFLQALRNLLVGFLIAAAQVAVIGTFLFGMPLRFLMGRYFSAAQGLPAVVYREVLVPLFQAIGIA